jgi:hypothetical protein
MIPTLLKIAVGILIPAATADGVSTARFLRKGYTEADRIMIWIYGTDDPSVKRMWVRSSIAVALEVLVAGIAAHYWTPAGYGFGVGYLCQAAYHVYCTVNNYRNVP